eukprot:TRINITY_DN61635_c0_g1_i1.p1 TRINITY_DN61635_c0_g1~~TRINITY_DN61635_c0_g1_i1.p1  ORF type:complete len:518 (-),score=102.30 TRINITY_DN61635_c0_g1_i1:210-1763(-)
MRAALVSSVTLTLLSMQGCDDRAPGVTSTTTRSTTPKPTPASTADKVAAAVQPVMDMLALKYNVSFQVGFADAADASSVGLAAGCQDIWTGAKLEASMPIPLGSATKPWTAVRVLQAVERGALQLEDAAELWVDPPLRRLHNLTMAKLYGESASRIRILDLLGMTSGLEEYDDAWLQKWSMDHDTEDVAPHVYLEGAARSPAVCVPRNCTYYAGTNYVLLGFALVELDGVYSWQEMDQMAAIPSNLRKRYKDTTFPKNGRCLEYAVSHSYVELGDGNTTVFDDLWYNSCLNGWTMGNIASTAEDMSKFFVDLVEGPQHSDGLLSSSSLKQMMDFHGPVVNWWCVGPRGPGSCKYGLGLERDSDLMDWFGWYLKNGSAAEAARLIGHNGQDWGSGAAPCGYNAQYHFGFCIARTSQTGLNCSLDSESNSLWIFESTLRIYDAVMSVVGGPRFDLSIIPEASLATNRTCTFRKVKSGKPSPNTQRQFHQRVIQTLEARLPAGLKSTPLDFEPAVFEFEA